MSIFKQYTAAAANENGDAMHLRGLLDFSYPEVGGVRMDEVESVDSIVKRFKTGCHELRLHCPRRPTSAWPSP